MLNDGIEQRLCGEVRFNAKLKHGWNQTAEVVTENLAKGFIGLRHIALAAEASAECYR